MSTRPQPPARPRRRLARYLRREALALGIRVVVAVGGLIWSGQVVARAYSLGVKPSTRRKVAVNVLGVA